MRARPLWTLALVGVVASCSGTSGQTDSRVTEAQFRLAAEEAASCLTELGWNADGPERDSTELGWSLGVSVPSDADKGEIDEALAALDMCWASHAADVEREYYDGLILSGEEWAASYADFVGCLDRAGVSGVEIGDPEEKVGEAIGENYDGVMCMQRYLWLLFGNDAPQEHS